MATAERILGWWWRELPFGRLPKLPYRFDFSSRVRYLNELEWPIGWGGLQEEVIRPTLLNHYSCWMFQSLGRLTLLIRSVPRGNWVAIGWGDDGLVIRFWVDGRMTTDFLPRVDLSTTPRVICRLSQVVWPNEIFGDDSLGEFYVLGELLSNYHEADVWSRRKKR